MKTFLFAVSLALCGIGSARADGSDQSGSAIRAQHFAANGSQIGSEVLINTATSGSQTLPMADVLADGNVIVVWSTQVYSPDFQVSYQTFRQILSVSGELLGTYRI